MPLCGGNIDTTVLGRVIEPNPNPTLSLTPAPPLTKVLGRVIERGLAADGRLVRLVASVSDRPGNTLKVPWLIAADAAAHHSRSPAACSGLPPGAREEGPRHLGAEKSLRWRSVPAHSRRFYCL